MRKKRANKYSVAYGKKIITSSKLHLTLQHWKIQQQKMCLLSKTNIQLAQVESATADAIFLDGI